MTKNITLYFLLFFLCVASSARGNPITANRAQTLAEEFFKSAAGTRSASSLKLVYTPVQTRADAAAEFYVFAPESDKGFVVVSGDDALTPIVGYGTAESFRADRMPDALKAWLEEYARYVKDVRAGSAKAALRTVSATRAGGVAIAPMVETKWNQSAPFNLFCPLLSNGSRTQRAPAGCVATAMAQVMKFHNWPETGEGSLTYYDGGEVVLDFSQSNYDWANMINVYTGRWGGTNYDEWIGDYTDAQANAVAKLLHECGRAVNMNYGYYASGAFSEVVPAALVDYFKYSPETKFYNRDVISTPDWIKLIRQNLEARRPMMYSGDGGGAGHAFVCDGIDANDLVHINWGWGGYCDGFFDMAYLAPDGTGIGGGNGYYFEGQSVVANIRPRAGAEMLPDPTLLVQGLSIEGDETQPVTPNNTFYMYSFVVDKVLNETGRAMTVEIAFCRKDASGEWIRAGNARTLNMDVGYYYQGLRFMLEVDLVPGSPNYMPPGSYEYSLCLHRLYTENPEPWYPLEGGYASAGVMVDVSATQITAKISQSPAPAQLKVLSVSSSDVLYENSAHDFTVHFSNSGTALFQSPVYYAFIPKGGNESPSGGELSQYIGSYITPVVYGNTNMDAILSLNSTPSAGEYRLKFYLQANGSYVEIAEQQPLYITVHALPRQMVPMLTAQLGVTEEVQQSESAYFYIQARMKAIGQSGNRYEGKLALYAMKKGDTSGKEYFLFDIDARVGTSEDYLNNAYGYSTITPTMEPGEYAAYLKYDAGGGTMEKVLPDSYNAASFTLKASDTPLVFAVGPVVVNDGNPVKQGSVGRGRLTLQSNIAYSGVISIHSGAYGAGGEYLGWILTSSENASYVNLQAGVPQVVEVEYQCNGQAPVGTYSVLFSYTVGQYLHSLSLGEYASTAEFAVIEKDPVPEAAEPRLVLDLQINEGRGVEQGSTGEIKASILCERDYAAEFYPISITDNNEYVMSGYSTRVNLTAGVAQEVTLRYDCPSDAPLGTHRVVIYYIPEGDTGNKALDLGDYSSSAEFTVVLPTGLEDERAEKCRLLAQPGAFLLKGVAENSRVQVSALDGRTLFRGIATDTEMLIPMNGAASGLYLVTIEMPDGKVQTLKGMFKK